MKIEERMSKMLEEHGLWPQDVPTVLALAKQNGLFSDPYMKTVWSQEETGFPQALLGTVWTVIKRTALEWIDKNEPQAFYRGMFV